MLGYRADYANFFTDIVRQYANNPEAANHLTIFLNENVPCVPSTRSLSTLPNDVKMEYYSIIINYLPAAGRWTVAGRSLAPASVLIYYSCDVKLAVYILLLLSCHQK